MWHRGGSEEVLSHASAGPESLEKYLHHLSHVLFLLLWHISLLLACPPPPDDLSPYFTEKTESLRREVPTLSPPRLSTRRLSDSVSCTSSPPPMDGLPALLDKANSPVLP